MEKMSSMERTLITLSHKEPDRIPLFLLATMHGAKELNLSFKDYFSSAKNIIKGQIRLNEKFQDDCLYTFRYASLETEAWGGDVIHYEDGPANAGAPIIKNRDDIEEIEPPIVRDCPCLQVTLDATEALSDYSKGEIPIIGVAISPFSLPVMQMGYGHYIDLMYESPDLFWKLMKKNEDFCVEWSNAQLEAGATAICYFDPISSTTSTTAEMYRQTGFKVAKRTLARIKGATATHMASGRCIPIIEDIAQTGTAVLGVSALENMSQIKSKCRDKLTILGNLNGIEMRHWTPKIAEEKVKEAIFKGGFGGGFILSDNHGEIPPQVPDSVLFSIRDAVRKWGAYPQEWRADYEE